jgi:putative flippase GtrA
LRAILAGMSVTLRRAARCMAVSIGTTVLSTTILIVLAVGLGMRAGTANVIAVACGILPSYLGNRRWVWGRTGKGSLPREVAPFWAMSLAGLVASTLLVDEVGTISAHWSGFARAIVLPTANLAVFGALWLVQFVVLDRIIFSVRSLEHS